jgi:hypothetical protein
MSTRARRGVPPPIEIQYQLPPEDQPLVDLLVTEDDKPVDNLFAEKQRWLLVDPLYASWRGGPTQRPFVAASDVGIFPAVREAPLAPDAFLSVDVQLAEPLDTRGRAYFFWEYGKPPDVAVEVVSNHKGGAITRKLQRYAQMGIPYYAVFDRANRLRRGMLRLFQLGTAGYESTPSLWMREVELGFTIWHGPYEAAPNIWLRWCDNAGRVYPTGAELALQAQQLAEQEHTRAEQERSRAERLAARLRALGIDPDQ